MGVAVKRMDIEGMVPSAEELLERARAMVPVLKARAKQCTAARNVPAETIAEMKEAGFFRILQPANFGGYEMHPNAFFEVQKVLAEGCMSTGWMYGVLGCHPYEMALFHEKAQQEVWGDDPDMLVCSTYQPVGKVTHVEGGFRLSGRWGFSTGSVHSGWILLGAFCPPKDDGTPAEMRTFLLPRSDFAIDENAWHEGTEFPSPFGQFLDPRIRAACSRHRPCAGSVTATRTIGLQCLEFLGDDRRQFPA